MSHGSLSSVAAKVSSSFDLASFGTSSSNKWPRPDWRNGSQPNSGVSICMALWLRKSSTKPHSSSTVLDANSGADPGTTLIAITRSWSKTRTGKLTSYLDVSFCPLPYLTVRSTAW